MKNKALLTIIAFLNISFFIMSFTSKVESTNKDNSTEILLSKILVEIKKLNENISNEEGHLNFASRSINEVNLGNIENVVEEVLFDNIEKETTTYNEETIEIVEVNTEVIVLEENKEITSDVNTQLINNENYNPALIDEIDNMYFGSTNQARSVDKTVKEKKTDQVIEIEKDLEDFLDFNDFVHPEVILEQTHQKKIESAAKFVSDEHELTPSSYYNVKDVKNCLKAEKIENEFTGYAVNLIVTKELLTTENPMFYTFGGLKVEKNLDGEYRYFLDGFKTRKGADDYLNKIILPRFPEAEAVFYKKGQRKNKTWQFFFGPK